MTDPTAAAREKAREIAHRRNTRCLGGARHTDSCNDAAEEILAALLAAEQRGREAEREQLGRGWFLPAARINDLQQASVEEQIRRCKQAHFTNLEIRINGKFETHEADWVKHLVAIERGREAAVPACRSLGWAVLGDGYGTAYFEEKSDAEYRVQAAILNGAANVSIAEVFVRLATAPHKGADDGK